MAAAALIVFREIFEIALVVSIVMAAARGIAGRNLWIALGLAAGIAGSLVVAGFAEAISGLASGMGQELFNATVLFCAVAMLAWHNVWMSRHGRELAVEARSLGIEVRTHSRPVAALAAIAAVTTLREGSEIVLFLHGIAAAQNTGASTLLTGGAAGLAGGVLVGIALYGGLLRISGRRLFTVTGWMILLLAAAMAAQGAAFLVQAGWLPSLGDALWDTSWLLPEGSAVGALLHALIGYTARPDGIQIVFYAATLALIGGLMRFARRPLTA